VVLLSVAFVSLVSAAVFLIARSPGRARSVADAAIRSTPGSAVDGSAASSSPGSSPGLESSSEMDSGPTPATRAFADVAGISLFIPARHVLLIGYHEAVEPEALTLHPLGRCEGNRQRPRYRCGPPEPGPRYTIMHSRHRHQSPTSAVDVAMPRNEAVRSPVTGTVASVRTYWLYGQVLDDRLVLIPRGRRDLRVILLHIRDVRVRRGQRVVAGATPVATVRALPFASEVNRYVGPGISHVHIEVKRVGPPGRTT